MKEKFFKGACIAYILLGSVFFPKSAWAEEPLGTMVYHDIKDFGEYYDSESAITYAFIKGTLSSCSDSTNICTVTSDNGKEVDISVEIRKTFRNTAVQRFMSGIPKINRISISLFPAPRKLSGKSSLILKTNNI